MFKLRNLLTKSSPPVQSLAPSSGAPETQTIQSETLKPTTQPGLSTAKIIEDLRRDEGVVPHAYQDHLGYWTIGVGRLIDKRKGGGLSPEEIDYLLSNDIKKVQDQLDRGLPWWRTLSEPRQRVLVNMCFQMGINGLLGFKNTLRFIRDRQYDQAAENMMKSKWARQTPERAKRMAEQMRTGHD